MVEYKYLVDSNIIIYHLNGDDIATNFLITNKQYSAISIITYIEVLSFDFESEEARARVRAFLDQFRIIDADKGVAVQALDNRMTKKIKLPDNIIASTAQMLGLILVTRNIKDFTSLVIEVLNPFEDI